MRSYVKVFSLLFTLMLLLSAFSACGSPTPPAETTEAEQSAETTDAAVTTEKPAGEDGAQILPVVWNFGYVGSDKNSDGFLYTVNPDGVGYSYTDIITVEKAGTRITFSDPNNGRTQNSVLVISTWYVFSGMEMINPEGILIRGNDERVMNMTTEGTVYTYVTSSDNESIRICYASGQQSSEDPVTHPNVYYELTQEPGTGTGIFTEEQLLEQWFAADKERAYYDTLEGITFTVIGDSYLAKASLASGNNWPTLLAKKYGMTYKNYGIGGSTISNYTKEHNPMVDRYTEMAMNDPDVIIVEGGRNDYNFGVPLGTLEDTSTQTMMGATRYLLTKIRERYPNAVVIGLTCWETGGNRNSAGHYCREYGEAMLAVCADLGIPCINALDQKATGVYMTDPVFRMNYCRDANDVSHLNDDGMRLVMPFFEKEILRIYEASKK